MPGACGVAERVQLMTEGRNFRGVAIFASLKMTALRKVALAMEELAYEAGVFETIILLTTAGVKKA